MSGAYMEFFIVLAFAIGWAVLEYAGRRLDRKREEERAREGREQPSPGPDGSGSPPA